MIARHGLSYLLSVVGLLDCTDHKMSYSFVRLLKKPPCRVLCLGDGHIWKDVCSSCAKQLAVHTACCSLHSGESAVSVHLRILLSGWYLRKLALEASTLPAASSQHCNCCSRLLLLLQTTRMTQFQGINYNLFFFFRVPRVIFFPLKMKCF